MHMQYGGDLTLLSLSPSSGDFDCESFNYEKTFSLDEHIIEKTGTLGPHLINMNV